MKHDNSVCRCCEQHSLQTFLDLGITPIADRLLTEEEAPRQFLADTTVDLVAVSLRPAALAIFIDIRGIFAVDSGMTLVEVLHLAATEQVVVRLRPVTGDWIARCFMRRVHIAGNVIVCVIGLYGEQGQALSPCRRGVAFCDVGVLRIY